MKKTLSLLISLSLITPLSAEPSPMSQAQAIVNASHVRARASAIGAINNDFNYALSDMLNEVSRTQNVQNLLETLLTENNRLQQRFSVITRGNPDQIRNLELALDQGLQEYSRLIRERFDLSFMATQARSEYMLSLVKARDSLARFGSVCRAGRGIGLERAQPFEYPDIKPQFNIQVGFGSGPNGSTGSIQFNSQGTGSQTEQDRNAASQIAGNVAGVSVSVMASGAAGTGAAANAAMAAAPYALGAAVAVAVVVAYMNHEEQRRMQQRIADARMFAFSNAATDQDVSRYYRESCTSLAEKTSSLSQILNRVISNRTEIEQLVQDSNSSGEIIQRYNQLLAERQILHEEASRLSTDPQNPQAFSAKISELRQKDEQISALMTTENLAKIMIAFVVTTDSQFRMRMSEISFEAVDRQQRAAYARLSTLIERVSRESFSRYLGGASAVAAEIRANGLFQTTLQKLNAFVLAEVQMAFGRISNVEWTRKRDELRLATRNMIRGLRGADVMGLAQQATALAGN